jgi:hypothetical protein
MAWRTGTSRCISTDKNPLVFVDTADNSYFHFIDNEIVGHPNGLLSTADALYLSDLNYPGLFGNAIGSNPDVPADQLGESSPSHCITNCTM